MRAEIRLDHRLHQPMGSVNLSGPDDRRRALDRVEGTQDEFKSCRSIEFFQAAPTQR